LLLINVVALNFDWWRMSREAANLRASMKQIYLSAYPKETVILDPLLQMRQKITAAKHDSGVAAADDFSRLVAEFSQAWDSTHPADSSAIVSLTYQQRSLLVQLKSPLPAPAMQAALAAHQLNLEVAPDAATTWTIRSQK
jgi:general secretion pathway protein L